MKLNSRQLAIILASLRLAETQLENLSPDILETPVTECAEIDDLCEALNTSQNTQVCIEVSGGIVAAVYTDGDDLDVSVLDWDDIRESGCGWGDTPGRGDDWDESDAPRIAAIEAEGTAKYPREVY